MSKFQIYFNGKRLEEGDFPCSGKTVSDCNSFERAVAKIDWNLFLITDNLRAIDQPICVVEIEPEIIPFKVDKIIPFSQKITDPHVHVLANKIVRALHELRENWGLKVTDWNVDDIGPIALQRGSEIELQDLETQKKKWIQIGR